MSCVLNIKETYKTTHISIGSIAKLLQQNDNKLSQKLSKTDKKWAKKKSELTRKLEGNISKTQHPKSMVLGVK